jgi:DNA-binding transcriptional LysR family regulator
MPWADNRRLRYLAFFKAVADMSNFTLAAERCGVTQPTLSAAIRTFEQELGADLFERTTRRVHLTRLGHSLLPLANAVLTNIDLASRDIRALAESERQSVRVAAVSSLTSRRLPAIIRRFGEEHPAAKIMIQDVPSPDVARLVRDGEVDIGIGLAPFDPDLFEQYLLSEDMLVVVCSEGHRFFGQEKVSWRDLADETVTTFKSNSSVHQMAARAFAQVGLPFSPDTYNYRMTVLGMAAHGLAVAILPSLEEFVYDNLRQVPLVEPVVRRRYCLIHRKDRPLMGPIRPLIEIIMRELSG